tara:strand:+ start:1521 stop:1985 length:465 start_codon:yes stop_codon:yes gene_type:complete
MNILNSNKYKCYLLKEKQCRKNISRFEKILIDNQFKLVDHQRQIDTHTTTIREINFDIECIEDPVSRPLGSGQENRRIEILIRQLESKVKKIESKIHWHQGQLIRVKILIETYERKIQQEKNHLITLASVVNKFTRDVIEKNDSFEKYQKINTR